MMNSVIKAVIFDMDGVLIDSEIAYISLLQKFLAESGVRVENQELYFLAGSARELEDCFIAEKLQINVHDAKQRKYAFYAQNPLDYAKIKRDAVDDTLMFLKNRNIAMALASSSPIDNIEEVLSTCGISQYFSFKISGDMFVRTKPDPEIYEYTVKQLGVAKENVLVVEDSTYGIIAAKRAGLKVVALLDPNLCFDVELADYQIQSLRELERYI